MMPAEAAPLTCFLEGQRARIAFLGLDHDDAQRLRDKCILGLSGCRIALQREVASRLLATPA